MRAGELRNRVIIQQKSISRNNPERIAVESWVDVVTVWAEVKDLRGKEFFQAQAVNAEVTAIIRIRYRTGITPVMRVKFGSRIFGITSPPIDPDGRRTELQLMCKELV